MLCRSHCNTYDARTAFQTLINSKDPTAMFDAVRLVVATRLRDTAMSARHTKSDLRDFIGALLAGAEVHKPFKLAFLAVRTLPGCRLSFLLYLGTSMHLQIVCTACALSCCCTSLAGRQSAWLRAWLSCLVACLQNTLPRQHMHNHAPETSKPWVGLGYVTFHDCCAAHGHLAPDVCTLLGQPQDRRSRRRVDVHRVYKEQDRDHNGADGDGQAAVPVRARRCVCLLTANRH